MRNCIILGSGRSGTSMLAGSLAAAGYFMGDDLYPGHTSNPKGFFEGPQINRLNEALLGPVVPAEQGLGQWQLWLAQLGSCPGIEVTPEIASGIAEMVQREPFCFKDPRFSYTATAWLPFLRNTAWICVFREPGLTAASIVRECSEMPYLSGVRMDLSRALDIWSAIYRAVLSLRSVLFEIIFVHYSQVIDGSGLTRISRLLDAPVDGTFADSRLSRARSILPVPPQTMPLYRELCELAGFLPSPATAEAVFDASTYSSP